MRDATPDELIAIVEDIIKDMRIALAYYLKEDEYQHYLAGRVEAAEYIRNILTCSKGVKTNV